MADVSSSSDSECDPVEALADELLERVRRGERPALTEYIQKYPQWADRIRKVLPAVVVMEGVRPKTDEGNGAVDGAERDAEKICLDRLGDYRILRELGHGGMGIVYEADQESLGRHVALKVLPAHALLDPKHLQRFRREAKAAARLHHTNIVPVFGVGEQDGLHYYVMQFIQGLALDEVLAEVKRLRGQPDAAGSGPASNAAQSLLTGKFVVSQGRGGPEVDSDPAVARASGSPASSSSHLPGQPQAHYPRAVAWLGVQVAEALEYAHSQGILHRDIKPSNLLIDAAGTVWVTDFGLAKAADSEELTHTGDVVGTVRYMAPERFQAQADARSDVYALGLTLYEMLTLRPAFDETDRSKLVAQVMNAEPRRLRQVSPEAPRDLETIVLKALARDPARRYPAARELAADLRRFLKNEPIRARRPTLGQRVTKWVRRHPGVAVTGGVSAVLVLLLVIVGLVVNDWLIRSQQAWTLRARASESTAVAELHRQLGQTYKAMVSYEEARDSFESLFRTGSVYAGDLAHIHDNIAVLKVELGWRADALRNYEAARALREQLVRDHPGWPQSAQALARTRNSLADLLAELGWTEEALRSYEAARALLEKLVQDYPGSTEYVRDLASTLNKFANFQAKLGQWGDASQSHAAARALREQLVRDHPGASKCALDLGETYCNMGNCLSGSGDVDASLSWYGKSFATLEPVSHKEAWLPSARLLLRNSHWGRAKALGVLHRHAEALQDWDRAIALDDRHYPRLRIEWALALARLGDHARAAAVAAEETVTRKDVPVDIRKEVPVEILYDSARVTALCVLAAEKDAALSLVEHKELDELRRPRRGPAAPRGARRVQGRDAYAEGHRPRLVALAKRLPATAS
jgi:serine/threonine protein kinase